ncbi:hypothetical protein ACH5RR_015727 [Cinchona calisaya]|uniref:Uncharacterized protein n=1 Tax=Cinchona calisaya TaxID=153742 RepID=A0ABD2ZV71_9GENT
MVKRSSKVLSVSLGEDQSNGFACKELAGHLLRGVGWPFPEKMWAGCLLKRHWQAVFLGGCCLVGGTDLPPPLQKFGWPFHKRLASHSSS